MAVTQQGYNLVIDGREISAVSGRTATVSNPAAVEVVASVPVAGGEDVNRAVQSAVVTCV